MVTQGDPSQRMLLEFRARDAWSQRNYAGAQQLAEEWATLSSGECEEESWWNASFLAAECLRKQDLMDESRQLADVLESHVLTRNSAALRARVATLRAFALQGSGDLAGAVEAAKYAVNEVKCGLNHTLVATEALNALIAALAESGLLKDAWRESLVLDGLLKDDPNNKYAGESYWAIGNVAFLLRRIPEGVSYHELAARTLSPTNDLDLWARFNRGSADFRLAAGVIAPETLECIERAEVASSIVGGTERDRMELKLIRAQWLVLTREFDAAVEQLATIIEKESLLASHTAAQAHFLLGEALLSSGKTRTAEEHLLMSAELFIQSGAEDRAAAARGLLDSMGQAPD